MLPDLKNDCSTGKMSVHYPSWKFRKMNKGEMNVDPLEGEFFSTGSAVRPG